MNSDKEHSDSMRLDVWEYRFEVEKADDVYVGKIYEHDELVATLTANTLAELRQQFSDWIAG